MLNISDSCSGIKISWSDIYVPADRDGSFFPIPSGTSVLLSCKDGLVLEGDSVVTCVSDTLFKYEIHPYCTSGGAGELNDRKFNLNQLI